ncbi:hypothetical protein AALN73_13760 [Bacteroides stercorirosoris]|uniref:hypothetical protein n=1 Tax=Bacteroides stercorirosoris TaxID=871324 RepID=UPI0023F89514|nr:hypothetical protein [Bacteroides stercorirosoris]
MVQLVCQNDIVISHPFACHCQSTLDGIATKDYQRSGWFDGRIVCLSLDDYETNVCKGSKDSTMDAAIGVGNYENNRITASRLMLVELRMGYENVDNLSVSSLESKISHSKDLLAGHPVDGKSYFVFKDGVSAQAKSWVERRRKEVRERGTWVVLSVNEFNHLIQFIEDMPYVPKNDWGQIAQKLKDCIANKNWEHLCKQTDYWREKALDYKYRYELAEFEGICTALLDVWNTIKPDNLGLNTSSDDYCLLYITKDDLSCLRIE